MLHTHFKFISFAFLVLFFFAYISYHALQKVKHEYTLDVTYTDGTQEEIKISYEAHPNDELILDEECIHSNMNNVSFSCGVRKFKIKSHYIKE